MWTNKNGCFDYEEDMDMDHYDETFIKFHNIERNKVFKIISIREIENNINNHQKTTVFECESFSVHIPSIYSREFPRNLKNMTVEKYFTIFGGFGPCLVESFFIDDSDTFMIEMYDKIKCLYSHK